jgi:putative transposase
LPVGTAVDGHAFASERCVARGARLDTSHAVHHVIARGIERRDIFCDADDRHDFLARLGHVADDFGLRLHAWSLLPNHLHLLAQTGDISLSRCMHRLLAGYAVRFNFRHQRSGYLFQNRFKSTLVDEHAYLLELVRYIHLNPVRAGLLALDALEQYPWSGHAALLGAVEVPPWQDVETVLAQFSADHRTAVLRYRAFVHSGMALSGEPPQESGIARVDERWAVVPVVQRGREAWAFVERVLGGPAFVDDVRRPFPSPPTSSPCQRPTVEEVLRETATRFNLRREELLSGGRRAQIRRARNVALQELVRRCGLSFAQSGRLLGTSKWTAARALKA